MASAYFAAALAPVLGLVDHYFLRYSFVGDHFQYPNDAIAQFNLGNALSAQGNLLEATYHLRHALNLATAQANPGSAAGANEDGNPQDRRVAFRWERSRAPQLSAGRPKAALRGTLVVIRRLVPALTGGCHRLTGGLLVAWRWLGGG